MLSGLGITKEVQFASGSLGQVTSVMVSKQSMVTIVESSALDVEVMHCCSEHTKSARRHQSHNAGSPGSRAIALSSKRPQKRQ